MNTYTTKQHVDIQNVNINITGDANIHDTLEKSQAAEFEKLKKRHADLEARFER